MVLSPPSSLILAGSVVVEVHEVKSRSNTNPCRDMVSPSFDFLCLSQTPLFLILAITAQLRFRKVIFTVLVEAYTALLCPAPSGHEFQSQGFWSLCDVNDVFLLTDPVLTVCAEWRRF